MPTASEAVAGPRHLERRDHAPAPVRLSPPGAAHRRLRWQSAAIPVSLTNVAVAHSWFRLRRGSLPVLSAVELFSESIPLGLACAWATRRLFPGLIGVFAVYVRRGKPRAIWSRRNEAPLAACSSPADPALYFALHMAVWLACDVLAWVCIHHSSRTNLLYALLGWALREVRRCLGHSRYGARLTPTLTQAAPDFPLSPFLPSFSLFRPAALSCLRGECCHATSTGVAEHTTSPMAEKHGRLAHPPSTSRGHTRRHTTAAATAQPMVAQKRFPINASQ